MRKNATKIAALALSLALTVTSVNIPTNASAATVKLNKTKATLYASGPAKKKTTTLKVTGTKKKVTFTSSKKSVATVNKKGKVTAKKAGKATITAKVGKKSYKCKVTVKKKYTPVTSVSVNKKSVSLAVGKTSTIKATVKPAKATQTGVTYKSNKTSVATVSSKGKITAKKAGSAKITVTTKGITKSGSNKKATVAVTVTGNATEAPSTAPSDAPSTAPSDAPSTAPSDTPSTAPGSLGNITEFKATKVTQLMATFDSAVPADTTFEIKKGTAVIDGKYAVDGNTVTFDATGKLSTGTYALTATSGDVTRSAETEVKDEYVAEIKITSKEALTAEGTKATTGSAIGQTEKLAYIYYDVLNQYAESIRTSTTINWTASATIKKVDKGLGRITVSNGYSSFIYGSLIYVTGVHTGSGTVINESIPVGMAQAVDSVEFSGFLNKNDKTKMVESLPKDFTKKTYYLLYKVADQNGSPLDPNEVEKDSLTFICDNPLLLSLDNNNTSVFTVNGEEYAAIAVEPGQYVDKGGEVNITAISTRTGKKTVKNYVVGSAGVLQSLVLAAPAGTVADGDKDVKLPYTAKDTSGNTVTNYETIVRSTNTLQLSASGETQLTIKEENDGTAGIYWSDSEEYDPSVAETYEKSDVCNDLNRSISLTTVVVGGESNNLMLEVSDIRRPNAIKSVKLNDDNNDAIIARNTTTLKFNDGQNDNTIVFLDQYGDELNGDKAKAFFANAKVNKFGKSSDAGYYGIKVAPIGEKHLGLTERVYLGQNIDITAADVTEVETDTVKYSIAKSADKNDWDDVSKVKSVSYTIVPVTSSTTTDFSITDISKVYLETTNSGAANGSNLGENATGSAMGVNDSFYSSAAYAVANAKEFKVMASYKGLKLSVPHVYYEDAASTEGQINKYWYPSDDKSQFAGITKDVLTWSDLYDFNSAKNLRKDAVINFKLDVYAASGSALGEKLSTISKKVTVSDEEPKATTIKFITNTGDGFNAAAATTGVLYPSLMKVAQPEVFKESWRSWNRFGVMVFDQYGNTMTGENTYSTASSNYAEMLSNTYVEFTVSDIKENTGELAHKPDSFIVKNNGSADMSIEGAEIGDTFKITATVAGLSASATVTVGADTYAYIDQSGNGTKEASPGGATKDIGLRELLGYDR